MNGEKIYFNTSDLNEDDLPDIDIIKEDNKNIVSNKLTQLNIENENNTIKISFHKRFYGIFLGILSAFFLSLSNTFIKKAQLLNASEQTAVRYTLQLITMLIIIFYKELNLFGKKEERKLLILRGIFGMFALTSLHFSVKFINPSDSVALLHTNVAIVFILARVFLKEKISLTHILALFMTIVGVILISQPSFLFNKSNQISNCNYSSFTNSSFNCNEAQNLNLNALFGISIGLFAAICSALVAVLLKKLSSQNVHYSVTIIYASYFGLPMSLLLSFVIYMTGVEKKNPELASNMPNLTWQIFFSIISASSGVLSQILMNLSLKYEDASKISIIRSIDLLFTFILQYIYLDIYSNIYSTFGALLIFLATLLIMIFKIIDQKIKKNNIKKSFFKRLLLFKI